MEEATNKVVDLNSEFHFKVDAKGRVSLPAQFRKVLSDHLVVTRNPSDECLYVFEAPSFNDWVSTLFEDRFGGFDASNRTQIQLRRKLKSRARDVDVDASGRIMLPLDQREAVGITKEIVIVGNTGYFEIWDAKRYADLDAEVDLNLLFGEA
ncbi:MAG: division/cell wall cluster transcriptional repressor MraZ [Eggerthellaceae bacterium]|jgi:MraZ protein